MTCSPWTACNLVLEGALLVLWTASCTQDAVEAGSPLWLPTLWLATGLSLSVALLLTPSTATSLGRLLGWMLRLHRANLAYGACRLDALPSCTLLSTEVRLTWMLLVKSGILNTAIASLILPPELPLFAAQQLTCFLILIHQAPGVCIALHDSYPRLLDPLGGAGSWGEGAATMLLNALPWAQHGQRAAHPLSREPQAVLACHSAMVRSVVVLVVLLPITLAWLARGRGLHGEAEVSGRGTAEAEVGEGSEKEGEGEGATGGSERGRRREGGRRAAGASSLSPFDPSRAMRGLREGPGMLVKVVLVIGMAWQAYATLLLLRGTVWSQGVGAKGGSA